MRKIIVLFLFCFVFISCNKYINITGQWENNERILVFDEYGGFEINFKNSNQIQAFRGSVSQKNNIIVLIFEEYKTKDNEWKYIDETDLLGHKEVLQVDIQSDSLYTKIIATGKEYIYDKKVD